MKTDYCKNLDNIKIECRKNMAQLKKLNKTL